MTVTDTKHFSITVDHLIALYQLMLENGDKVNADKISDLYRKWKQKAYNISFAGHFSAGKSSMINALLERDVLPKSPIPTSANIVSIASGNGTARVYFHKEPPIEYDEPYDMDMIKEYCKNKDAIKRIDIRLKDNIIPEGKTIVDTPGIDAADDADRVMTESSLHLVDILFYVMDYNHVQSEVNLHFLQNLQEMKLPYFVVINQIDKHQENELPFTSFQDSVAATFRQWQLRPEGIYYTSLFNMEMPNNQFTKLKQDVFHLLEKPANVESRITSATEKILADHRRFLKQMTDDHLADHPSVLHDKDAASIADALEQITAKWHELHRRPREIKETFTNELNHTLKNAYLMPAALRDRAEEFLKTMQDDFKVGMFGSRKKTELAKKQALENFLQPLQETIASALQWKLRDKFLELLKANNLHDEQLQQLMQSIKLDYSVDDLKKQMKPGARLNGTYLLHYTNDVASDIKNKYKQLVLPVIDRIEEMAAQQIKDKMETLQNKKQYLETEMASVQKIMAETNKLQKQYEEIEQTLHHPSVSDTAKEILEKTLEIENQPVEKASVQPKMYTKNKQNKTGDSIREKQKEVPNQSIASVLSMTEKTIDTISGLQGLQSIIKDLRMKQERLHNRTVTIALFGAFSAGKSSFVNALIGEDVLPSSPNPTTAAITRMMASNNQHRHGTAVVHLKSEQMLQSDLLKMVEMFNPPQAATFEELLNWIEENVLNKSNDLLKLHESYLRALLNGYAASKDKLGTAITVSMDQFRSYAAEEEMACYVAEIDVYYDCAITAQGIILVDTPGADSMNARHTNVSFDYIKYADAILYVTYYNHALSRADKDFLTQLGRVKEAFELDKMFFMLNASDLAQSKDELNMVTAYVKEQLNQLGIRFPRVFPISSRKTLTQKLANEEISDEMAEFEDAFFRFIHQELVKVMLQGMVHDMQRAKKTVDGMLTSAQLDENEKQNRRKQLLQRQDRMEQEIREIDMHVFQSRVDQKIEKQIFYIQQRFGIRFHDMFKETFNPTTITESGKAGIEQLKKAMVHLLDYAGYELLQEVRATGLRVEKFMNDTLHEFEAGIYEKIHVIDPEVTLSELEKQDFKTPDFQQPFTALTPADFRSAFAGYKGTKAFFAKKQKEQMKDNIFHLLTAPMEEYLHLSGEQMQAAYQEQLVQKLKNGRDLFIKEIAAYVDNSLAAMAGDINADTLLKKQQRLQEILEGGDAGNEK